MSSQTDQMFLFTVQDEPDDVWRGVPAVEQEDLTAWRTVYVHLATEADYHAFKKAIGADGLRKTAGLNTHTFWYPPTEPKDWSSKEWVAGARRAWGKGEE